MAKILLEPARNENETKISGWTGNTSKSLVHSYSLQLSRAAFFQECILKICETKTATIFLIFTVSRVRLLLRPHS